MIRKPRTKEFVPIHELKKDKPTTKTTNYETIRQKVEEDMQHKQRDLIKIK